MGSLFQLPFLRVVFRVTLTATLSVPCIVSVTLIGNSHYSVYTIIYLLLI